jgi:hypothetical protein
MPARRERSKRIELGCACIGEKIYRVFLVPGSFKKGGLAKDTMGQIFYEGGEILISERVLQGDFAKLRFLSTLIHEFIHAILRDKFDDDSAEKIAIAIDDRLALALLTFFDSAKNLEKFRKIRIANFL